MRMRPACGSFTREDTDGFAQVREEHNAALVSHIPRIHVHRTITYVTSDDLRLAYVRTRSGSRTISPGAAVLSVDCTRGEQHTNV